MSIINQNPPSNPDPGYLDHDIGTNLSFSVHFVHTDEGNIPGLLGATLGSQTNNTALVSPFFLDVNDVLITDTWAQTNDRQYEITEITHDSGVYEYTTEGNAIDITVPTGTGFSLESPVVMGVQYTEVSFPLIHYSLGNWIPPNFPGRNDAGSVPITLPDPTLWPPVGDSARLMTFFTNDPRHTKTATYTCTYKFHDYYSGSDSTESVTYTMIIHNFTGEELGNQLRTYFAA